MEPEDPKVIPFSRANNRGKKSKGPSLAARTGIGAAAAAVILLIAVFNMPKSLPGADLDMSSKLMSGGAANSSMSTESSADAPQADGQNNSGSSSDLNKMDQATPSESADVNLKSAPPAPSEGADQPAAAAWWYGFRQGACGKRSSDQQPRRYCASGGPPQEHQESG